MHGLETIVKQNQTRFEKAIDTYRSQGRWVLAKYTGLHLVSIETFGSAEEAAPEYAKAFNIIGEHAKLLPPDPGVVRRPPRPVRGPRCQAGPRHPG